jgi:hypothetical protein
LVCYIVSFVFTDPINKIIKRIISEDIYTAWAKYIQFAIFVVGISSGVRIWELERYMVSLNEANSAFSINFNRFFLEIYRTVLGSLQGIAWLLFVFFLVSLIAFIIIKVFSEKKEELKK